MGSRNHSTKIFGCVEKNSIETKALKGSSGPKITAQLGEVSTTCASGWVRSRVATAQSPHVPINTAATALTTLSYFVTIAPYFRKVLHPHHVERHRYSSRLF